MSLRTVTIFLISFLVIVLAVFAMAIGVIVQRRPITAGCGRLRGLDGGHAECDVCGSTCQANQGIPATADARATEGY